MFEAIIAGAVGGLIVVAGLWCLAKYEELRNKRGR